MKRRRVREKEDENENDVASEDRQTDAIIAGRRKPHRISKPLGSIMKSSISRSDPRIPSVVDDDL